jgi:hypothetical protein
MKATLVAVAVAATLVAAGRPAAAQTIGYYRFEQDTAGNTPAPGEQVPFPPTNDGGPYPGPFVFDQSGNANHMRVFANFAAPIYTNAVPTSTIPSSGAANARALDFTPNQDLYTIGNGAPLNLNTFDFTSGFTVEASFFPRDNTRFHGIVGQDGKPTASLLAPLQMKLRDDNNQFQIEVLDSSGAERSVLSTFNLGDPSALNQWYHLAAVSDGALLSLFIRGPADSNYVLQGQIPTVGGIFASDATWTIGRGFFNNGVTDWSNGIIDEVRISGSALAPSQFLFAPIPEPGSLALAGLGLPAAAAYLRRRRAAVAA